MSERACIADTVCGIALRCLLCVPALSTTIPGRCALSLNMASKLSWFVLSLVVRVYLARLHWQAECTLEQDVQARWRQHAI